MLYYIYLIVPQFYVLRRVTFFFFLVKGGLLLVLQISLILVIPIETMKYDGSKTNIHWKLNNFLINMLVLPLGLV